VQNKTQPTKTGGRVSIFYKTSMVRSGQHCSGHIYPHEERDTNDGVPILSGDVEIFKEHSAAVHETEQNDLTARNKWNYHNWPKHLYTFWQEKYPQYYAVGVWAFTEKELGHEDMFWWKI
jgi:predicted nucleotide-binding protein (sugar kinase/HSP70/actin superfamily)